VLKSGRSRNARTAKNIATHTVRDNIAENPEISERRRAQECICNAAKGGHLADISHIMLRNKLPKYTKKIN